MVVERWESCSSGDTAEKKGEKQGLLAASHHCSFQFWVMEKTAHAERGTREPLLPMAPPVVRVPARPGSGLGPGEVSLGAPRSGSLVKPAGLHSGLGGRA